MRRISLAVCLFGLLAAQVQAQEAIALTVPITKTPIADMKPGTLFIDRVTSRIIVQLVDTSGGIQEFAYPCAAPCARSTPASVATMITNFTTTNFSVRNMWRTIFDRLVIDFPARFPGGATVQ